MATTFILILTCVPGRTCLSKTQFKKLMAAGPGVMDLTVFGERECVFGGCVISPRPSDSLRRAKQNKIIFVWFHSSQRRRTERGKKKQSPSYFHLSLFIAFSRHPAVLVNAHEQRAQTQVTARQVFLIITVSVSLLWGGGEFPTRGNIDQCQRHVNWSVHRLRSSPVFILYPSPAPFRSYSLPLDHPRAVLTLLPLPPSLLHSLPLITSAPCACAAGGSIKLPLKPVAGHIIPH